MKVAGDGAVGGLRSNVGNFLSLLFWGAGSLSVPLDISLHHHTVPTAPPQRDRCTEAAAAILQAVTRRRSLPLPGRRSRRKEKNGANGLSSPEIGGAGTCEDCGVGRFWLAARRAQPMGGRGGAHSVRDCCSRLLGPACPGP